MTHLDLARSTPMEDSIQSGTRHLTYMAPTVEIAHIYANFGSSLGFVFIGDENINIIEN